MHRKNDSEIFKIYSVSRYLVPIIYHDHIYRYIPRMVTPFRRARDRRRRPEDTVPVRFRLRQQQQQQQQQQQHNNNNIQNAVRQ